MSSKLDILITASNEASGPINQIKKSLGGLGTVAGTTIAAAGAASIAAVAGITAVVADGVGKAAEMEQRVADIASVMGKSADEVQPLSNLISQLGIDPKLKVDATEAADAIEMLARNGVSMQEILDGAARSTVLLANATGASRWSCQSQCIAHRQPQKPQTHPLYKQSEQLHLLAQPCYL